MTPPPEGEASPPPPSPAAQLLGVVLGSYMRRTIEASGRPWTRDHNTEVEQLAKGFEDLLKEAKQAGSGTDPQAAVDAIRKIRDELVEGMVAVIKRIESTDERLEKLEKELSELTERADDTSAPDSDRDKD